MSQYFYDWIHLTERAFFAKYWDIQLMIIAALLLMYIGGHVWVERRKKRRGQNGNKMGTIQRIR